MKKYAVLLMIVLNCVVAFSGCSDLETKDETTKTVASEEKAASEKHVSEQAENKLQEEQEQLKEIEQQLEQAEKEQATIQSELKRKEEQEKQEELENLAEMTDIQQIGEELYDKACHTIWSYVFDCPYELDYEDTYENAVRVVGKDSLADVLEDYNKVFTGDRPELQEKYISTQNALYCYDGGRGANIYYQDTNLELVSFEGDTAVFNAVSHYADPETFEPMEDEVYTFVIVRTNDEWRVSDFTLPY